MPYVVMLTYVIEKDVFEIFVVADILLAAGAVRAALTRLKDDR